MLSKYLPLIFLITLIEISFVLFIGYVDVRRYRKGYKTHAFFVAFFLGIFIVCFLIVFLFTIYYHEDRLRNDTVSYGLTLCVLATIIVIIIVVSALTLQKKK